MANINQTLHDTFVEAVHNRSVVELQFVTKDGERRTRRCAPMDYGPRRRSADQSDCYHLWDYDGNHPLVIAPEQLISLAPLDEEPFDPAAFVTWKLAQAPWHLERDWDRFS